MSFLADGSLAFFVAFVLTAPYVAALRPRTLSFLLGATGATAGALVIEVGANSALGVYASDLLVVVLFAPIVEESLKLGVSAATGSSFASAAGAGLGFAATENGLYFLAAWGEPVSTLALLVAVRAVTDPLLHSTTTTLATAGLHGHRWGFPSAILVHGSWNLAAIVALVIDPLAGVVLVGAATAALFGIALLVRSSPSLRSELRARRQAPEHHRSRPIPG